MESQDKKTITIETTVKALVEKVWKNWTTPDDIRQWNHASDDWHTTHAENDLRTGGKFLARMEARDGSDGFDFDGVYDRISENKYIEYTLSDGRKVQITFSSEGNEIRILETFEAENNYSIEMQKSGWQAILDNFKKYVESH